MSTSLTPDAATGTPADVERRPTDAVATHPSTAATRRGGPFRSVFTKSLYDQRRGIVGWSIGVAATVLLMAALWPSFADMDFDAMLSQFPDSMKDVFNITSMSSGAGYLNAELFSLMLPAMFIIFAVSRGARAIAGEEEDGTLEVLAALPLTRRRLLVEKSAALVASVALLAGVLFASVVLGSWLFGMDIPVAWSAVGAITMFLLGAEFALLAVAIGAGTGRRSLTIGVASAIAGASYLLYLMAQLLESIRPIRVLSPFYQAISAGPLAAELPPIVLAMAAVGVGALLVAIPVFTRRDLTT